MDELKERHKTFAYAKKDERILLAKKILQNVREEKWCSAGNWVEKSCDLEGIVSNKKDYAAMTRFYFASIVKTWLETFIYGKPLSGVCSRKFDEQTGLFGPFKMDQGMSFDLFWDISMSPLLEKIYGYKENCEPAPGTGCCPRINLKYFKLAEIYNTPRFLC